MSGRAAAAKHSMLLKSSARLWKFVEMKLFRLFAGRSRGGAFAGASAGYGVGASAALGGNVDEYGGAGGLGSEAHARGISTKTVKLSQTPQQPQQVCH